MTTDYFGPWVYFARNSEGFIKIGTTSRDPIARLLDMRTSNALPLRLLVAIPGGHTDEVGYHRLFARARVRENGEWFRPSAQLVAFIDSEKVTNPLAIFGESAEMLAAHATIERLNQRARTLEAEVEDVRTDNEWLHAELAKVRAEAAPTPERMRPLADIVAEAERFAIRMALRANDGNRERAAKALNISMTTLWRKMTALAIVWPVGAQEAAPPPT
jgi:hypothetical protein